MTNLDEQDPRKLRMMTSYIYNAGEDGNFYGKGSKFEQFIEEVGKIYGFDDLPVIKAVFEDIQGSNGSLTDFHNELLLFCEYTD